MAGDAQRTIENFWKVQDSGDYTLLPDLFAEDALLDDPIYGRFEGREAIVGFMQLMVAEKATRKSALPLMKYAAMIMLPGPAGQCIRQTARAAALAYTRFRTGS